MSKMQKQMKQKQTIDQDTIIVKEDNIEFQKNNVNHSICLGDCFNVLDKIDDGSCKLIFADPPYNMGKNFGNNKDKWESGADYANWCIKWIEKCVDKLTDDGTIMIMGHPRYASYLIPYLDEKLTYVNQIIYYYTDGMPEKKNFEKRYEVILYYRKNKNDYVFNVDDVRVPLKRYDKTSNPNGKNPNDVWEINRVRWNSKERISNDNGKIAHMAQKPIRLLRRIILATTNKNDLILDPFVGTGTTMVAAKELSRRSIGIELNPTYADITMNRLKDTVPRMGKMSYEER